MSLCPSALSAPASDGTVVYFMSVFFDALL